MVIFRECCRDRNGKSKKKYSLKEDAKDAVRLLEIEYGVIAEVYECVVGHGWHLTTHEVRQEPRILKQNQPDSQKSTPIKTTIGKALGKDFFEQLKETINNNEKRKI